MLSVLKCLINVLKILNCLANSVRKNDSAKMVQVDARLLSSHSPPLFWHVAHAILTDPVCIKSHSGMLHKCTRSDISYIKSSFQLLFYTHLCCSIQQQIYVQCLYCESSLLYTVPLCTTFFSCCWRKRFSSKSLWWNKFSVKSIFGCLIISFYSWKNIV